MFQDLTAPPGDKILGLMREYAADPRPEKMDLGVGVYRDPTGHTPIMRAVKAAEKRLWETQDTKTYTGLAGDPLLARALGDLVLGEGVAVDRRAAIGTPGGTGAVRQALALVRAAAPAARVWIPSPTWANHLTLIDAVGLKPVEYRYFDPATGQVDLDGMLHALTAIAPGDVVLLHGCCHNPTGADLSAEAWHRVAGHLSDRGATALIDLAYQGFGDGLEADAQGVRILADVLPSLMIAISCSKNFGIYRERTGLVMALARNGGEARVVQEVLAHLNRQVYSFPPDHGARIVTTILTDPPLRADWESELTTIRDGMLSLRRQLAEALRQRVNSDRFDFVAGHRGMFSRLGLTPDEVAGLKRDHGVYMLGDSRINIAGLNTQTVPQLARCIAQVTGDA